MPPRQTPRWWPSCWSITMTATCWTRSPRCSTALRGRTPWGSYALMSRISWWRCVRTPPWCWDMGRASTCWPPTSPPSSSTPGRCAIWMMERWPCSPPARSRCTTPCSGRWRRSVPMWTGRSPRRRRAAMSTSCSRRSWSSPRPCGTPFSPACGGTGWCWTT